MPDRPPFLAGAPGMTGAPPPWAQQPQTSATPSQSSSPGYVRQSEWGEQPSPNAYGSGPIGLSGNMGGPPVTAGPLLGVETGSVTPQRNWAPGPNFGGPLQNQDPSAQPRSSASLKDAIVAAEASGSWLQAASLASDMVPSPGPSSDPYLNAMAARAWFGADGAATSRVMQAVSGALKVEAADIGTPLRLHLAKEFEDAQQYASAEAHFRHVPDDRGSMGLARCVVKQGDRARAVAILEEAWHMRNGAAVAYMLGGLMEQNNPSDAYVWFTRAGSSPEILAKIAMLSVALEKPEAKDQLAKALEGDPMLYECQVAYGKLLLREKNYAEATVWLTRAVEHDGSPDTRRMLVRAILQTPNKRAALRHLMVLDDMEGNTQMAQLMEDLGDRGDALRVWQKVVGRDRMSQVGWKGIIRTAEDGITRKNALETLCEIAPTAEAYMQLSKEYEPGGEKQKQCIYFTMFWVPVSRLLQISSGQVITKNPRIHFHPALTRPAFC